MHKISVQNSRLQFHWSGASHLERESKVLLSWSKNFYPDIFVCSTTRDYIYLSSFSNYILGRIIGLIRRLAGHQATKREWCVSGSKIRKSAQAISHMRSGKRIAMIRQSTVLLCIERSTTLSSHRIWAFILRLLGLQRLEREILQHSLGVPLKNQLSFKILRQTLEDYSKTRN
jgi:hypothetical protein